jgi:hypothetical protein
METWSNRRYQLCWRSPSPSSQVLHQHDPELRLDLSAQQQEQVEQRWRQGQAQGRQLERLPLYRLLEWQARGSNLHLRSGVGDYAQYLGLSSAEVTSYTVAGATLTNEGWVLEQRSQAVAEGQGLWHVKPSGHVHPPHDAWAAVLWESEEELGLQPDELQQPRCLGMVCSRATPCWALCYSLETPVAFEEICRRPKRDAWESTRLFTLPAEPDHLQDWLLQNFEAITGIGHATLLLAGGYRFGEAWWDETLSKLKKSL